MIPWYAILAGYVLLALLAFRAGNSIRRMR